MAKVGRPKSNNPSKNIVACKLTNDEYRRLLAYCEKNNVSKSEVLKNGIKKVIEEV